MNFLCRLLARKRPATKFLIGSPACTVCREPAVELQGTMVVPPGCAELLGYCAKHRDVDKPFLRLERR